MTGPPSPEPGTVCYCLQMTTSLYATFPPKKEGKGDGKRQQASCTQRWTKIGKTLERVTQPKARPGCQAARPTN